MDGEPDQAGDLGQPGDLGELKDLKAWSAPRTESRCEATLFLGHVKTYSMCTWLASHITACNEGDEAFLLTCRRSSPQPSPARPSPL